MRLNWYQILARLLFIDKFEYLYKEFSPRGGGQASPTVDLARPSLLFGAISDPNRVNQSEILITYSFI